MTENAANTAARKPGAGLTGGQDPFGSAAQRSIPKTVSRLYYLLQHGVKVLCYVRYNGAIFAVRAVRFFFRASRSRSSLDYSRAKGAQKNANYYIESFKCNESFGLCE